jgi:hypothetical protein
MITEIRSILLSTGEDEDLEGAEGGQAQIKKEGRYEINVR